MNPQNIHPGGAFESPYDPRDIQHKLDQAEPIPSTYDANYSNIPVQMQHQLGICTAEAVCTLIEHFRNDGIVLSRRFTYMVGKKLVDGNLEEGSAIKSMLHGAYKYGTQPESVVPTDTTISYTDFVNFDPTPYLATAIKIPGYTNVAVDPTSLASGIITYGGLAVRYDCGSTWYTDSNGIITWDPTRILPLQPPRPIVSGHAIVAYKYDYSQKKIGWIRNSWSSDWGVHGDGYSIVDQFGPTEAWGILATAPIIPSWTHNFDTNMSLGDHGGEVANLQKALQIDGCFPATQEITGNYGPITQQSVSAFQKKYKVSNPLVLLLNAGRYVGPATRVALNAIFNK